ncbi:MAG: tetratricopeptide repeat protein [Planctomycetota bacterium]
MLTIKLLACSIVMFGLASSANKTVFGVDNAYKYQKHEARFQQSSFNKFKTQLNNTVDSLEQKTEDLDAKNRNLEGRVDTLNEEKNALSKTCAQMKSKQTALEQDQARLKNKTNSLEAAYKKQANKNNAATAAKKQKPIDKKGAVSKPQKTKKGARKGSKGQKTATKKTSSAKTEKSYSSSQKSPKIAPIEREPVESHAAERRAINMAGDSDVKKINERGIEYGKQGKYDEAIKEFHKVVAIEPDIANVHYNLGLAYKKKGMNDEADKEFAEYERLSKAGH